MADLSRRSVCGYDQAAARRPDLAPPQFFPGTHHRLGVAIVVIFFLDVALALRSLDLQMLLLGGTLAVLCALYLFANHSLGGKWRPLPVKEKAIGILFAAGTTLGVVAQLPGLTISFGIAVLLFAILCTYNCLSIAAWERELDAAQGKASFMTGWPMAARALKAIGYGLCLAALGFAVFWRFAFPLWMCIAASAFLLVRLNLAGSFLRDHRTALADLVMLTPLLALPFLLREFLTRSRRIIAGSRRLFLAADCRRRASRFCARSEIRDGCSSSERGTDDSFPSSLGFIPARQSIASKRPVG